MFSGDMTWMNWTDLLNQKATAIINDIQAAKACYDKWSAMTYGLTDAQIQALPQFNSRQVADITAMRYAWGVFNDMYQALFGTGVLTQTNRENYLAPFV